MALDAGSVFVNLRAVVREEGFRDWDRRIDRIQRQRGHRIELGANVNEAEMRTAEARIDRLHKVGRDGVKVRVDADLDEGSFSRSEQQARRLGAAMGGMGNDADRTRTKVGGLSDGVSGFNKNLLGLRNIVGIIRWPALIVGAGLAAQAIGALTAGAIAAVSALGPLVGILGTIPGLAFTAATGVGAAVLGFAGIGKALQATSQAQQQASSAASSGLAQQAASADAVRSAEDGLTRSQKQVGIAQKDLTAARRDAVRTLSDMRTALINARLGEEGASLSLRRAQQQLREMERDPKSSGLDIAEAELGVKQAREAIREARIERRRAEADSRRGERGGVSGSPQVVSARRQLAEANKQVVESTRAVARAQQAAAQSAGTQSAAQSKLQQALDKLSPAGRHFVRTLLDMRPLLDRLRKTAQEGLLPGVEKGLVRATRNFEPLRRTIGLTSAAIGHAAARFGAFVGSRAFGRDFEFLGRRNAANLGRMARSVQNLLSALRHVAVAAQPFLDWMTKGVLHMSRFVDQSAKAGRESGRMTAFFSRTRAVIERLGSILQSLSAGFLAVGKAATPLGREIFYWWDRAAQRFEDFAESTSGQNTLAEYFRDARGPLREGGRLIINIGKAILDLGRTPGLEQLLRTINQQLLPALTDVVKKTSEAFGPALIEALTQILRLLGNLAGANAPLTLFIRTLGKVAQVINDLLETVPGLRTLTTAVLGVFALRKFLSFSTGIFGIGKLRAALASLEKSIITNTAAFRGMGAAATTAAAQATTATTAAAAAGPRGAARAGAERAAGQPGGFFPSLLQGLGWERGKTRRRLGGFFGRAPQTPGAAGIVDEEMLAMAEAGGFGLAGKARGTVKTGGRFGALGRLFGAGSGARFGGALGGLANVGVRGAAKFALPIAGGLAALDFLTAGGGVRNRSAAALSGATFGLTEKLGPLFQRDKTREQRQQIGSERAEKFLRGLPGGLDPKNLREIRGSITKVRDEIVRLSQDDSTEAKTSTGVLKEYLKQLRLANVERARAVRQQSETRGQFRAQDLQRSFRIDLKNFAPEQAIQKFTQNTQRAMKNLGPAGRRALGEANLAWAKQQEKDNPKLKGLYEEVSKTVVKSFSDTGKKVIVVNGEIITGTREQLSKLGTGLNSVFERNLAKSKKPLTDLQERVSATFQHYGLRPGQADRVAKAFEQSRVKAHGLKVMVDSIRRGDITPKDAKNFTDLLTDSDKTARTLLGILKQVREHKITEKDAANAAAAAARVARGGKLGPVSPRVLQTLDTAGAGIPGAAERERGRRAAAAARAAAARQRREEEEEKRKGGRIFGARIPGVKLPRLAPKTLAFAAAAPSLGVGAAAAFGAEKLVRPIAGPVADAGKAVGRETARLTKGFRADLAKLPGIAGDALKPLPGKIVGAVSKVPGLIADQLSPRNLGRAVGTLAFLPLRIAESLVTGGPKVAVAAGKLVGKIAGALGGGEVIDRAKRLGSRLVDVFKDLPGKIVHTLRTLPGRLADRTTGGLRRMRDAAEDGAQGIIKFFGRLPGRIVAGLRSLPGRLAGFASRALDGMRDGAEEGASSLVKFFGRVPGRIADALKGIGKKLFKVGKDAAGDFMKGFAEKIPKPLRDAFKLGKGAVGKAKDFVGGLVPGAQGGYVASRGFTRAAPVRMATGGVIVQAKATGGRTQTRITPTLDTRALDKEVATLADHVRRAIRVEFRGDDPVGIGRALRRSLREAVDVAKTMATRISRAFKGISTSAAEEGRETTRALERNLRSEAPVAQARKLDRQVSAEFDQLQKHALGSAQTMESGLKRVFGRMPDVVSVPMSKMLRQVGRALDALGASSKSVSQVTAVAGNIRKAAARGGYIDGVGRHDTVPMSLPVGTPVLNRHQQKPVQQALSAVYGIGLEDVFTRRFASGGHVPVMVAPGEAILGDETPLVESAMRQFYGYGLNTLFQREQRPHWLARGGRVEEERARLAGGGKATKVVRVPGDPSTTGGRDKVAPGIAEMVGKWIKRYKAQVGYAYDPGGGHKSPGHNVTGTATDVVPGPGGNWDTLERGLRTLVAQGLTVYYGTNGVGTPLANHGRGNHAHIEWGDAKGLRIKAAGRTRIPPVRVAGKGAPKELVKGATETVRKTANRLIGREEEKAMVRSAGADTFGAGKAAPPGKVREWLTKALKITNHFSTPNLNALYGRAQQESGGNPLAVNRWDSNAKAGHPSQGLLQTIPSTFDAYKMKGYGNILDPVHNAIAAIRYMFAKYKHIVGPSSTGYARGGFVQHLARGGTAGRRKARRGRKRKDEEELVPMRGRAGRLQVADDEDKRRKPARRRKRRGRQQRFGGGTVERAQEFFASGGRVARAVSRIPGGALIAGTMPGINSLRAQREVIDGRITAAIGLLGVELPTNVLEDEEDDEEGLVIKRPGFALQIKRKKRSGYVDRRGKVIKRRQLDPKKVIVKLGGTKRKLSKDSEVFKQKKSGKTKPGKKTKKGKLKKKTKTVYRQIADFIVPELESSPGVPIAADVAMERAIEDLNRVGGPVIEDAETAYATYAREAEASTEEFIRTTKPDTDPVAPGTPIAPVIDAEAVSRRIAELERLIALKESIVAKMQDAVKKAQETLEALLAGILRRKDAIERIKRKIRDNLDRINGPDGLARKRDKAEDALDRLAKATDKSKKTKLSDNDEKMIAHDWNVVFGKNRAMPKSRKDQETEFKGKLGQYKNLIGQLRAQNVELGGSSTKVGSAGLIGDVRQDSADNWEGQVADVEQGLITLRGRAGGWMGGINPYDILKSKKAGPPIDAASVRGYEPDLAGTSLGDALWDLKRDPAEFPNGSLWHQLKRIDKRYGDYVLDRELKKQQVASGTTLEQDLKTLQQSIADLTKQFGSNIKILGQRHQGGSILQSGAYALERGEFVVNPDLLGRLMQQLARTKTGTKTSTDNTKHITVNNSFTAPPPDPHSFSKSLAFEVRAAI